MILSSPPAKWTNGSVANSITPAGGTGISVGIGTTAPSDTLHVDGGVAGNVKLSGTGFNGMVVEINSDSFSAYSFFYRSAGTQSSKTAVLSGSFLGSFGWRAYNGTSYNNQDAARMSAVTEENVTGSTQKSALIFYTNPSGSIGTLERMRIGGDGSVSIGNGELSGVFTTPSIKLQYASNNGYWHIIHTRHAGGAAAGNAIDFYTNDGSATPAFPANAIHGLSIVNGQVGLGGKTSPTAALHLPAGTATANTAPLKFTAGTNLSTPENGAMEFDGTHLYITISGVRTTIV